MGKMSRSDRRRRPTSFLPVRTREHQGGVTLSKARRLPVSLVLLLIKISAISPGKRVAKEFSSDRALAAKAQACSEPERHGRVETGDMDCRFAFPMAFFVLGELRLSRIDVVVLTMGVRYSGKPTSLRSD